MVAEYSFSFESQELDKEHRSARGVQHTAFPEFSKMERRGYYCFLIDLIAGPSVKGATAEESRDKRLLWSFEYSHRLISCTTTKHLMRDLAACVYLAEYLLAVPHLMKYLENRNLRKEQIALDTPCPITGKESESELLSIFWGLQSMIRTIYRSTILVEETFSCWYTLHHE